MINDRLNSEQHTLPKSLREVCIYSGPTSDAASDGKTVAEYTYDPFGRRIWKDVIGSDDAVSITFFVYSNEGLIAEYDEAGNIKKKYGYILGADWATNPLYQWSCEQNSSGEYYWYINDHLGTPQRLIDNSGTVVWAAIYDAFGKATILKDDVTNNLRFPGQYYDEESGLHYNFHRYYDPELGRYIQADPLGMDAGMNYHVYCGGNPLIWIDPLGLHLGGVGGLNDGDEFADDSKTHNGKGVDDNDISHMSHYDSDGYYYGGGWEKEQKIKDKLERVRRLQLSYQFALAIQKDFYKEELKDAINEVQNDLAGLYNEHYNLSLNGKISVGSAALDVLISLTSKPHDVRQAVLASIGIMIDNQTIMVSVAGKKITSNDIKGFNFGLSIAGLSNAIFTGLRTGGYLLASGATIATGGTLLGLVGFGAAAMDLPVYGTDKTVGEWWGEEIGRITN